MVEAGTGEERQEKAAGNHPPALDPEEIQHRESVKEGTEGRLGREDGRHGEQEGEEQGPWFARNDPHPRQEEWRGAEVEARLDPPSGV